MDPEALPASIKTETSAPCSNVTHTKRTSDQISTLRQANDITVAPDSASQLNAACNVSSQFDNPNIIQELDSNPIVDEKVESTNSNGDKVKDVVTVGSNDEEDKEMIANSNDNVQVVPLVPNTFDEVTICPNDAKVTDNMPLDYNSCVEVKHVNVEISAIKEDKGVTLELNASKEVKGITVPKPVVGSHHLKVITWKNNKVQIVTQNENGPCPLIAIANILLLRGKIKFPSQVQSITADQLIEYVASMILDNIPVNLSDPEMLDYERNMQDAIAVLPRLLTGLDVNVKFTGVQDFEFTPECIIFDLLNIPLYHGWLVDPQAIDAVAAIGTLGYNQLVDKIIVNKSSTHPDLVTDALIAEQFLEGTASQMTYHGLCELNLQMKSEELAVLFRNNHFSTVLKKGPVHVQNPESSAKPSHYIMNELFQLVTDQGFLQEPKFVWETIINIEGDGTFVDSMFCNVSPKTCNVFSLSEQKDNTKENASQADCNKPKSSNSSIYTSSPTSHLFKGNSLTREQQINQDYLVALSLAEDLKLEKAENEKDNTWKETIGKQPVENNVTQIAKDAEFALSLHNEELSQNGGGDEVGSVLPSPSSGTSNSPTATQQSISTQPVTSSSQRKKSTACAIF